MLMRSPIVFADCYSVLLCCLEGKYILRLIWSQGSVIEGEGTILPRFLETVLKKSILTHVQAHAYLGFGH